MHTLLLKTTLMRMSLFKVACTIPFTAVQDFSNTFSACLSREHDEYVQATLRQSENIFLARKLIDGCLFHRPIQIFFRENLLEYCLMHSCFSRIRC